VVPVLVPDRAAALTSYPTNGGIPIVCSVDLPEAPRKVAVRLEGRWSFGGCLVCLAGLPQSARTPPPQSAIPALAFTWHVCTYVCRELLVFPILSSLALARRNQDDSGCRVVTGLEDEG
jgi:hypothetical protein